MNSTEHEKMQQGQEGIGRQAVVPKVHNILPNSLYRIVVQHIISRFGNITITCCIDMLFSVDK